MSDAPLVRRSRRWSRAALLRRKTRMATANARGERLKYCTERSSLVNTTNPKFLAIEG